MMTAVDQSRAAPLTEAPIMRKQGAPNLARQQRVWGWIFLSPWIVGFVIFTAAPIIFSFILTFTKFELNSDEGITFIGLSNWAKLFSDPLSLTALGVTIKFALIAVPIGLLVPLGMAALLNSKRLQGKRLWRLLFYLPYMVPAVSGIFIWQRFMNGESGWLNRILRGLGVADPPNWFQDANWITVGFVIMGFWGVGNAMLTMLATMQGVPTELYEAADVDGANGWTKFRKITFR